MRKSRTDIWSATGQSATGVALVMLSVVSFIMALWVLIALVRTLAG